MSRYGYPMNQKTRPQVINQLRKAIRERALPYMPTHLIQECSTFCEFEDGLVSPRAQQGCNDDAVLACRSHLRCTAVRVPPRARRAPEAPA